MMLRVMGKRLSLNAMADRKHALYLFHFFFPILKLAELPLNWKNFLMPMNAIE